MYFECSAQSGNNISQAFQSILEDIHSESGDKFDLRESGSVDLSEAREDIYEGGNQSSPGSNNDSSCKC